MDKSYFGVSVVMVGNKSCVPLQEIERLPFYAFWLESARGSALLVHPETDEKLVYLHDWVAFCALFIRTGKHRFMDDAGALHMDALPCLQVST